MDAHTHAHAHTRTPLGGRSPPVSKEIDMDADTTDEGMCSVISELIFECLMIFSSKCIHIVAKTCDFKFILYLLIECKL